MVQIVTMGPGKVDIVAPGGESAGCPSEGILSTIPQGDYGFPSRYVNGSTCGKWRGSAYFESGAWAWCN